MMSTIEEHRKNGNDLVAKAQSIKVVTGRGVVGDGEGRGRRGRGRGAPVLPNVPNGTQVRPVQTIRESSNDDPTQKAVMSKITEAHQAQIATMSKKDQVRVALRISDHINTLSEAQVLEREKKLIFLQNIIEEAAKEVQVRKAWFQENKSEADMKAELDACNAKIEATRLEASRLEESIKKKNQEAIERERRLQREKAKGDREADHQKEQELLDKLGNEELEDVEEEKVEEVYDRGDGILES